MNITQRNKLVKALDLAVDALFVAAEKGFCPTGPGGGTDNSCGSSGGGGGSAAVAKGLKKAGFKSTGRKGVYEKNGCRAAEVGDTWEVSDFTGKPGKSPVFRTMSISSKAPADIVAASLDSFAAHTKRQSTGKGKLGQELANFGWEYTKRSDSYSKKNTRVAWTDGPNGEADGHYSVIQFKGKPGYSDVAYRMQGSSGMSHTVVNEVASLFLQS